MRVHLITTPKVRPEYINYGMYETLCHDLPNHGKVVVADKNPDLVHIFGLWNKHYLGIATKFADRGIPVVFTSLNGLPPLVGKCRSMSAHASCIKKITKKAIITQVCGPAEESIVKNINKRARIETILNPYYTSLTSTEKLLFRMEHLYENAAATHDKKIRSDINLRIKALKNCSDSEKEICSQMLYLKYLLHRGCIPRACIDKLASTLSTTDYDENHLATTLKQLEISKMAARFMQVMYDMEILTEGFMPIEPIDDKQTQKMEECIV